MKDYLAAIAVLLLAAFLLIKLALSQVSSVNRLRGELSSAQFTVDVTQRELDTKRTLMKAANNGGDVDSYLAAHTATLQRMREIGNISQAIGSVSESLSLPIQEQKTTKEPIADSRRQGMEAHLYTVSVLASFRNALVWLGRIEDTFPFCRVERVEINPSGTFVSIGIEVLFPVVNTPTAPAANQ